ncbi:DUF914-domain-containing protein [Tothia fuscella]|uniref:DUF914-domain-containing protein n=1 Tax=Tothia fuscella TaxID=1048955 RepID=A0A9P4U348_9PEZI|nr:DUF914-domain-containing protein [Tothia fuscella]
MASNSAVQSEMTKTGELETTVIDRSPVLSDHGRANAEDARLGRRKEFLAYIKTKQFWVVLLLGQVLALCIVGTNTLSSLLNGAGANIPAFQTFFNYVLLNAIWTSITLYKYGFKKWGKMVYTDGWRYFILAFLDVEGNYFTVLAYRYTTILSAQLINFWAIVVVVVMSFLFLKVRYGWTQILGIFVCIGGMGLLFASDHITGANNFPAENQLKGDLFALLGATFYGFSNAFQEFLVSKRPMYEVVGQLAFWAMIINGVQAGIFDRSSFRAAAAVYQPKVGGYIAGFDLLLTIFYSLAPILFRMSSAAFFNISLLTGNFWGTIVGIHVFHYTVHWLYPVAFVLIIVGLFVYFIMDGTLGDSLKPWLGENQEQGVSGVGTARRRLDKPNVIV